MVMAFNFTQVNRHTKWNYRQHVTKPTELRVLSQRDRENALEAAVLVTIRRLPIWRFRLAFGSVWDQIRNGRAEEGMPTDSSFAQCAEGAGVSSQNLDQGGRECRHYLARPSDGIEPARCCEGAGRYGAWRLQEEYSTVVIRW